MLKRHVSGTRKKTHHLLLPSPLSRAFSCFLADRMVAGLISAVEGTLDKLLKHRGYGRVEIVIKVGGILGRLVLIWFRVLERIFFLTILVSTVWKSSRDETPRYCGYDWLLQPRKSQDREINNVPFFRIFIFTKHDISRTHFDLVVIATSSVACSSLQGSRVRKIEKARTRK